MTRWLKLQLQNERTKYWAPEEVYSLRLHNPIIDIKYHIKRILNWRQLWRNMREEAKEGMWTGLK
jgi:hypothetical protein